MALVGVVRRFVVHVGCPKQFETNIGEFFMIFDRLVASYFSRFGDFCAHNNDDADNDDRLLYPLCMCIG